MFEYIQNKELKELLEKDFFSDIVKKQKLREYGSFFNADNVLQIIQEEPSLVMCLPDEYIATKEVAKTVVTQDGSYISFISQLDRSLVDKEVALESVNYRNFFIREADFDNSEQVSLDTKMLYEVINAYDALSLELQNDIDIVKTAYLSYKNIIKYLEENPNPQIRYSDGVVISIDSHEMINIINDEIMPRLEEKYPEVGLQK